MIDNYDKCQNAAHFLNHQASMSKANFSRKHFTPCAKASIFILGADKPLMQIIQDAVNTSCLCHSDISGEVLLDYCFDDRVRNANYCHILPVASV